MSLANGTKGGGDIQEADCVQGLKPLNSSGMWAAGLTLSQAWARRNQMLNLTTWAYPLKEHSQKAS